MLIKFSHAAILSLFQVNISWIDGQNMQKKHIFTSKPSGNDSSESKFAHISWKMISLALKCKPSKEVLAHVNNGIDKLASEVDDLLSTLSLEETKDPESFVKLSEDIANTRVSFKAPSRKKGPCRKDLKELLRELRKAIKIPHQTKAIKILHQSLVAIIFQVWISRNNLS